MENKVLIRVLFPELDKNFDVYIPVNEIMWKIKILLSKSVLDLCNINLKTKEYLLINKETSEVYKNNDIVINTDIRNGTELILVSINKQY